MGQSLLGKLRIIQSAPVIIANLNILWFKNFNYEIMVIEIKKKDNKLWYSLNSTEKWLKWIFLKLQNWFFSHVQLEKAALLKYIFLELQLQENRNVPRKKPEILMFLRYHSPLCLRFQTWANYLNFKPREKQDNGRRDILNLSWISMRSLSWFMYLSVCVFVFG